MGVNWSKEAKDLDNENYKALKKKIKRRRGYLER